MFKLINKCQVASRCFKGMPLQPRIIFYQCYPTQFSLTSAWSTEIKWPFKGSYHTLVENHCYITIPFHFPVWNWGYITTSECNSYWTFLLLLPSVISHLNRLRGQGHYATTFYFLTLLPLINTQGYLITLSPISILPQHFVPFQHHYSGHIYYVTMFLLFLYLFFVCHSKGHSSSFFLSLPRLFVVSVQGFY